MVLGMNPNTNFVYSLYQYFYIDLYFFIHFL